MYEITLFLLLIAAVTVLPMALTIPIGLLEKRLVWPYIPLEEEAAVPRRTDFDPTNPYAAGAAGSDLADLPLSRYAATAREFALSMGFVHVGGFRDGKGRIYKVRYDFYLSPERDVLALVGGGAIATIPLIGTWLFTRLTDGRCLRTVDAPPASEMDIAGMADEALIPGVDFAELVARHRGRLAASFARGANYDERDPLADHRDFNIRRTNRLEQLGLIRFLDPERKRWRYSLRGAVRWAARAHFRGLRRAVWSDA